MVNICIIIQFSLDRTSLYTCLSDLYNISRDEVNQTTVVSAGIYMGQESNICTQDGKLTTHFPEVSVFSVPELYTVETVLMG